MNKHTYLKPIGILLSLLWFASTGACKKENTLEAERALLERVDQFNTAFKESNLVTLESMVTENYQHTNGNGKPIGKTDWLAYLEKRESEIKNGTLTIHQYEMLDVQLTLFGEVGVVTSKISVQSTNMGAYRENEYRTTNVWVKDGKSWKRAAFHDGKIR
ncbi:nuclear transport factor 2 family protein [Flavobacteriaceae bacterium 3-367]